jgi:hypothetical protein
MHTEMGLHLGADTELNNDCPSLVYLAALSWVDNAVEHFTTGVSTAAIYFHLDIYVKSRLPFTEKAN